MAITRIYTIGGGENSLLKIYDGDTPMIAYVLAAGSFGVWWPKIGHDLVVEKKSFRATLQGHGEAQLAVADERGRVFVTTVTESGMSEFIPARLGDKWEA